MLVHIIVSNVMFHVVQRNVRGIVGGEYWIQRYKKEAKEQEDKVKNNEEVVRKLEKRREQYEGELWVK